MNPSLADPIGEGDDSLEESHMAEASDRELFEQQFEGKTRHLVGVVALAFLAARIELPP